MTIRRRFADIAVSWDSYDAFGSTMAWWFGCAIALDASQEQIPEAWEYQGQPTYYADLQNGENDEALTLTRAVEANELSWDDVRHIGGVLQRYRENLARTGRDY